MHILSFWAKTRETVDGTTQTHALVCHLLDVAAVADVLLERFPKRLERLAALLDADASELRGLIVRLAALHDLGKFHPDFQRKLEGHCEQHLPELVKYINPKENPIRHDILGFMIAEQIDLKTREATRRPAPSRAASRLPQDRPSPPGARARSAALVEQHNWINFLDPAAKAEERAWLDYMRRLFSDATAKIDAVEQSQ